MSLLFIFQFLIIFTNPSFPPIDNICLSSEEVKLFESINIYRKAKGLSPIPFSEKLTKVAQTHAKDLSENYNFSPDNTCNPHSWSDKGNWTSCCYTNDHKEAQCMWDKPKEIAGYNSPGYEIAYYNSAGAKASEALAGWKKSNGHNPLLINSSIWKKTAWKGLGIGIYKNYAVVWFGELEDISTLQICK